MNNPFGLPDEVMTAIITAVMKQNGQPMKNPNTENIFKVDTVAMTKKSAKTAKELYDAYVEAGFTNEQAFELVKGILTAKKN